MQAASHEIDFGLKHWVYNEKLYNNKTVYVFVCKLISSFYNSFNVITIERSEVVLWVVTHSEFFFDFDQNND